MDCCESRCQIRVCACRLTDPCPNVMTILAETLVMDLYALASWKWNDGVAKLTVHTTRRQGFTESCQYWHIGYNDWISAYLLRNIYCKGDDYSYKVCQQKKFNYQTAGNVWYYILERCYRRFNDEFTTPWIKKDLIYYIQNAIYSTIRTLTEYLTSTLDATHYVTLYLNFESHDLKYQWPFVVASLSFACFWSLFHVFL